MNKQREVPQIQPEVENPSTDYIITATLTVVFGMEDETKPSEEQAQETFLEWIGTVSDGFITEGLKIEIEEDTEQHKET